MTTDRALSLTGRKVFSKVSDRRLKSFAAVWNESNSVGDVIETTGLSRTTVHTYARDARRIGLKLKDMYVPFKDRQRRAKIFAGTHDDRLRTVVRTVRHSRDRKAAAKKLDIKRSTLNTYLSEARKAGIY